MRRNAKDSCTFFFPSYKCKFKLISHSWKYTVVWWWNTMKKWTPLVSQDYDIKHINGKDMWSREKDKCLLRKARVQHESMGEINAWLRRDYKITKIGDTQCYCSTFFLSGVTEFQKMHHCYTENTYSAITWKPCG